MSRPAAVFLSLSGALWAHVLFVGCGGQTEHISLFGTLEQPDAAVGGTGGVSADAASRDAGPRACGTCSAPTPFCDTTTGACVGCRLDTDCTSKLCDQTTHQCRACKSKSECSTDYPFCDIFEGKCVKCLTSQDCSGNYVCPEEIHVCMPPCSDNSDCAGSGRPLCATASRVCVECKANADCTGADKYCDVLRGSCVQCLADAHCATNEKCVLEVCKPCVGRECGDDDLTGF